MIGKKILVWVISLILLAALLSACSASSEDTASTAEALVPEGNPESGQTLIDTYGCGTCHVIPGIDGANATVGPPLTQWSERGYIAGMLANTPENLVAWLLDPQAINPETLMPNVGLSEQQAQDIAAYLYTIE